MLSLIQLNCMGKKMAQNYQCSERYNGTMVTSPFPSQPLFWRFRVMRLEMG